MTDSINNVNELDQKNSEENLIDEVENNINNINSLSVKNFLNNFLN